MTTTPTPAKEPWVTPTITVGRQAPAPVGDAASEWVLVPRKMTDTMHAAGLVPLNNNLAGLRDIWATLLASAPVATPSTPPASMERAEDLGLRIAERIRQEMTSGRQWWLDALSPAQRDEYEADLCSTAVAVCEQECARKVAPPPVSASDMAAFGASDAACYLYPGEQQQAERTAFCEGAAHAVSALPVSGEVERNLEAQRQTIEACARVVETSWVIDGHMKERVAASVRALRPNAALTPETEPQA